MRTFICLALIAVASHSASASVLSFVKNNVYRLDNTNKVTATLNDRVESNTKVGTGEKSMCELSFDDKSVTRIGENSEFSFIEQERLVKCGDGKFLVSKDPPIRQHSQLLSLAIRSALNVFPPSFENEYAIDPL